MPQTNIHVTVTFPLAEGPFHEDAPPQASIGTVRHAAMQAFGVSEDPASVYYLTHNDRREEDDRTIGDVAGHAHAVKFTLVKETIQGSRWQTPSRF